jgi:hypothetical protein
VDFDATNDTAMCRYKRVCLRRRSYLELQTAVSVKLATIQAAFEYMKEIYNVIWLLESFGLCLGTAVRHGQTSIFEFFPMD